jgi:hypothetical protein
MTRQARIIIYFLLHAYPAAWREEYGEELASLLRLRPLRIRVVSNVALNGLWKRFESDPRWVIGGALLFLWTLLCIVRNTIAPLSPVAYSHIFWPFNLMSLVIGCWTMLHEPAGMRHAALASLKSALVGSLPEITSGFLWAIGLLHPTVLDMHGSPRIHGAWITLLFVRTDASIGPLGCLFLLLAVTISQSLLLGYVGAIVGGCGTAIKAGYRSRPVSNS